MDQYTYQVLFVKPETVKWFGEVFPDEAKEISDAISKLPGLVSWDKVNIDENTYQSTMIFESMDAFVEYKKLWNTGPWAHRAQYNKDNLIVTFVTQTDG